MFLCFWLFLAGFFFACSWLCFTGFLAEILGGFLLGFLAVLAVCFTGLLKVGCRMLKVGFCWDFWLCFTGCVGCVLLGFWVGFCCIGCVFYWVAEDGLSNVEGGFLLGFLAVFYWLCWLGFCWVVEGGERERKDRDGGERERRRERNTIKIFFKFLINYFLGLINYFSF